jgi:hypothetical protein
VGGQNAASWRSVLVFGAAGFTPDAKVFMTFRVMMCTLCFWGNHIVCAVGIDLTRLTVFNAQFLLVVSVVTCQVSANVSGC